MALSSDLQVYVMKENRMTQQQAQCWLDKCIPNWRTKAPAEPIGLVEHSGEE